MLYSKKNKGFTLVELAIVIVIIGALVGGVLAGQGLIDASKNTRAIADFKAYDAAIATFRSKFNAMPGDMSNATTYWGEVSTGCTYQRGTGTQTCNGDGDGTVDYQSSTNSPHESWRVWQHLVNAGVIKGSYLGISCNNCYSSSYLPAGVFDGTSITFWFVQTAWSWPRKTDRHVFAFANSNAIGLQWFGATLTPAQMHALDLKMDDGLPNTGSVVNMGQGYATNCSTSTTSQGATYVLTYTDKACVPLIDSVN
jgi:prepilin-type N-terminal cleavage/methylation domain-containing protein